MKIITLSAFCLLLLFVQDVGAQQKLSPNQAVAQNIEPGKTDSYSISLNDGDYVDISLSQRGRVNLSIIYPGGTVIRCIPSTKQSRRKHDRL